MNSDKKKYKYFCRRGWTGLIGLKPLAKSVFRRIRFSLRLDRFDRGTISETNLICPTSSQNVARISEATCGGS
jgi:hypothetical protein